MKSVPPVQYALRITRWLATVVGVLLLTIYFGWAFESRNMLQLGPEHRIRFDHEFSAAQEDEIDWAGYVEIEERLAAEVAAKIIDRDRPDSLVDRYSTGSLSSPERFPADWNRSYEVTVPAARGVAVLVHGLSDSPYSMLATAQTLAGAGYNVVVPRMPGHGFAVGGLLQSRWEDWTAAVRVAIRHAAGLPGADQSLLLAGYSNGGLLAIDYALACDERDDTPCPDGIVLMSPAIAVSSARISSSSSGFRSCRRSTRSSSRHFRSGPPGRSTASRGAPTSSWQTRTKRQNYRRYLRSSRRPTIPLRRGRSSRRYTIGSPLARAGSWSTTSTATARPCT
jgi:pimeloyl-ACP methyl ester carboxylesterase